MCVDIDLGYDGVFCVEFFGENDDKLFWITAKNVRMFDTSVCVKGSDEFLDRFLNGILILDDIVLIEMFVIGNYVMFVMWLDGLS